MNHSTIKSTQRPLTNRAGITLTEIMVSCVLLGGLTMAVLPMTMRIARQRLVHREILVARHELVNQMERLSLIDTGELQESELAVSDAHAADLHDADLKLAVDQTDDGMSRVQLNLAWTNRLGKRMHPQTLMMWIPASDQSASDQSDDAEADR